MTAVSSEPGPRTRYPAGVSTPTVSWSVRRRESSGPRGDGVPARSIGFHPGAARESPPAATSRGLDDRLFAGQSTGQEGG